MRSCIFRFTGAAALGSLLLAFPVTPILAAETTPSLQAQLDSFAPPAERYLPDKKTNTAESIEKSATVSSALDAVDAQKNLEKIIEGAPNDVTDLSLIHI